jgi:hypothetical protein
VRDELAIQLAQKRCDVFARQAPQPSLRRDDDELELARPARSRPEGRLDIVDRDAPRVQLGEEADPLRRVHRVGSHRHLLRIVDLGVDGTQRPSEAGCVGLERVQRDRDERATESRAPGIRADGEIRQQPAAALRVELDEGEPGDSPPLRVVELDRGYERMEQDSLSVAPVPPEQRLPDGRVLALVRVGKARQVELFVGLLEKGLVAVFAKIDDLHGSKATPTSRPLLATTSWQVLARIRF